MVSARVCARALVRGVGRYGLRQSMRTLGRRQYVAVDRWLVAVQAATPQGRVRIGYGMAEDRSNRKMHDIAGAQSCTRPGARAHRKVVTAGEVAPARRKPWPREASSDRGVLALRLAARGWVLRERHHSPRCANASSGVGEVPVQHRGTCSRTRSPTGSSSTPSDAAALFSFFHSHIPLTLG